MTSVKTCKECGRPNKPDAQICDCGALLIDPQVIGSTDALTDADYEEGRSQWGSARFSGRSLLMVGVEDDPQTFSFDGDEIDELVLGRADAGTGDAPAINLTQYGALDKGVSRVHAKIIRRDGSLQLEDLGSRNGTYLNGQRIVEHQPRILRDGDAVRLGKLALHITYQKPSGSDTP
jgi:hypothetical protein